MCVVVACEGRCVNAHRLSSKGIDGLTLSRAAVLALCGRKRCETVVYRLCTRLHEAADLYAVDALYS